MDLGKPIAAELLVAATADTAVVVRRVTTYPDRFTFQLVIRLQDRGSFDDFRDTGLTVEFSDGRALPMRAHGGGSSEHRESEHTVHELPDDGNVTFVFDWPSRGIADARASLLVART